MRIAWLIQCDDITRGHDETRYTLVGVGQRGFMLEAGQSGTAGFALMVCLEIEDDDEAGAEDEIWHQVIGPTGHPFTPIRKTKIRWVPGDSTPMVDPEQYHVPLLIEFDVDTPGPYTIEVGTLTETRETPVWVQEMPPLD